MLEQIQAFGLIDWLAFTLSIIYIILAIANKPICFVFGLLSALCWAYASYIYYNLFFDALLQIFYVAMSLVGIYKWSQRTNEKALLPISHIKKIEHLKLVAVGILISVLFAWSAESFLDIDLAFADALTSSFSIIATYLLVQRKIENWIYFIICDLVYALFIYPSQGAYLMMVMMFIFTIMAVVGYLSWKRQMLVVQVV